MISKRSKINPLIYSVKDLAEQKRTKLCVSLDVTSANELLRLVELLAPYVLMFKTHIDILEDFSWDVVEKLLRLSEKYDFFLFEDRKFVDIGNTVSLQYGKGMYRIADWAHITNAYILPGPGIIEGLKKVGFSKNRGLLLLADINDQDPLLTEKYQQQALKLAKQFQEFVIGFIAQSRMPNAEEFLIFTPGVQIASSNDGLNQSYTTPKQALDSGADVLIVDRSIYQADDPLAAAKKYNNILL